MHIEAALPGEASPAINRIEERKEIKALVIDAILKSAGFQLSQETYTDIHRFLDLAIEWDTINYRLISDRIGRNESELRRLRLLVENDPRRNEFLRAQGAIVIVPVRREHTASMRLLLRYGSLEGVLQDDEDIAVLLEVLGEGSADGDPVSIGEAFEVSIPTPLVYLRNSSKLPSYE